MKEKLYRTSIELTNGRVTSAMFKSFAKSKISKKIIPSFAKQFAINLDESKLNVKEFNNLHEFFIRELKDGIHSITAGEDIVISPVDASIEDFGLINETAPIVVKGRDYSITEMLGDEKLTQKYLGGTYIVFYLSPQDYHRMHAPISGNVTHKNTLGRWSYPVNNLGMKYGKDPLSKNFRQVTEIDHNGARLAMVKVGAQVINTIERTHENDTLVKGDEMAFFSFGSTVVLLFERGKFEMEKSIQSPHKIRMGQKVGELK